MPKTLHKFVNHATFLAEKMFAMSESEKDSFGETEKKIEKICNPTELFFCQSVGGFELQSTPCGPSGSSRNNVLH